MTTLLTTAQPITHTSIIWALPKLNPQPGEFPFRYEVFGCSPDSTHWIKGAIKVCVVELHTAVPAGVDLLAAALDTLDAQIQVAAEEYAQKLEHIERERKQLMMFLPAPATPEGGELVL